MKNDIFFLVIVCTICVALAQLSFKIGIGNKHPFPIFLGFLLYAIGGLIFIVALKEEQVSDIYPMLAMVFIWVLLLSIAYLNESVNTLKLTGVTSIVIGTILVGKGRTNG